MRRFAIRSLASLSFLTMSACIGDTAPQGCPLRDRGGDQTDLSYDSYIPQGCPIDYTPSYDPLNPGQATQKEAGAHLSGPGGPQEFSRAIIYVQNSRGEDAIDRNIHINFDDVTFAYNESTTRWVATLDATYWAATAWDGAYDAANGLMSSSANDLAKYQVYRTDGRSNPWADLILTYKRSPIRTTISGPDIPLAGTSQIWNAAASGGSDPYTYQWYRNGELVGSGPQYGATNLTSEFGLRVVATDQYNDVTHTDFWVDVDGVRAAISGAGTYYASQAGGTWTGSARGGYPPYSFQWYIEDVGTGAITDMGTANPLTGYLGDGQRKLRLIVTDTHSRSSSVTMDVNGIGGDCAPPADRC